MSGGSVVSYRNSTSNHNGGSRYSDWLEVVSYRNSTSNHNSQWGLFSFAWLYLIEILHQTTTPGYGSFQQRVLYLIEILHQTTTIPDVHCNKPELYLIEILHQTTTTARGSILMCSCILSKFYIKPQLVRNYYSYSQVVSYRNSTSNHNNIAVGNGPAGLYLIEILHQTTTMFSTTPFAPLLYLIEILHQTTTAVVDTVTGWSCILSKFYIKPQQRRD